MTGAPSSGPRERLEARTARAERTAREQARAEAAGFGSAWEQRIARGRERGVSSSVAGGKPGEGELPLSRQHPTFYGVPVRQGSGPDAGTALVDIESRNLRGGRVLGAYMSDIGGLLGGRLTVAAFESKWANRTVSGYRLEPRAAHVVEAMRSRGPEPGQPRYQRLSVGLPDGGRS